MPTTQNTYGSLSEQDGAGDDMERGAASTPAEDTEGSNFVHVKPLHSMSRMDTEDTYMLSSRSNFGTAGPSSCFPPILLLLVPEISPLLWTTINSMLAVSGCLLIADMTYAEDENYECSYAIGSYLIYECVSCFSWTLETTLSACYQHFVLHNTQLAWYTKLEIIIAAYYAGMTFWSLYQWNIRLDSIPDGKVWEIVVYASFYVYMSIRSCSRTTTESEEEEDDETQHQEQDGENDNSENDSSSFRYQILENNDNDNKTSNPGTLV